MKKFWMLLLLMMPLSWAHADVEWMDYEEAREVSSDKPVFVFGEMQFCSACRAMKKEVFTDPDLAQFINDNFVPAKEKTYGLTSLKFKDLTDKKGEPLTAMGYPMLMVVKGDQYQMMYGYQSADKLKKILVMLLEKIPS